MKFKAWLGLVSSGIVLAACGDGGARPLPQPVTERPAPNPQAPLLPLETPAPNPRQPDWNDQQPARNDQQPVSGASSQVPARPSAGRCRASDDCAACDQPCDLCECQLGADDDACEQICN